MLDENTDSRDPSREAFFALELERTLGSSLGFSSGHCIFGSHVILCQDTFILLTAYCSQIHRTLLNTEALYWKSVFLIIRILNRSFSESEWRHPLNYHHSHITIFSLQGETIFVFLWHQHWKSTLECDWAASWKHFKDNVDTRSTKEAFHDKHFNYRALWRITLYFI